MAEKFLAGDLKCKDCGRQLSPSVPISTDGTTDYDEILALAARALVAQPFDEFKASNTIFQCDRCPPGEDLLCADCVGTISPPPELVALQGQQGAPVEFVCGKCVRKDEAFSPWR